MLPWKLFAVAMVTTLAVVVVATRSTRGPWEAHQARMEDRLATAWRARHPGPPLPDACDFDDVRAGTWDADEAPGDELMITSQRFGTAMFAATGELLAFRDPQGCRQTTRWINSSLSGSATVRAVVLREQTTGCRAATWLTILERRGDLLVERARFREQDSDQCRWNGETGTQVTRWVSSAWTRESTTYFHVRERCSGQCPAGEQRSYTCSMRDHWVTGGCAGVVAAAVWPELAP